MLFSFSGCRDDLFEFNTNPVQLNRLSTATEAGLQFKYTCAMFDKMGNCLSCCCQNANVAPFFENSADSLVSAMY